MKINKFIIISLVFIFTTVIISTSCSNENQEIELINSKIKIFESKIVLTNKKDYCLIDLDNNKNNYAIAGTKFYNTIQNLKAIIWESKEGKKQLSDIKPQIDNLFKTEKSDEVNFNESEKILLNSFLKKFNISNGIELCIEYENFAIENFQNQIEVSNFLTFISQMKYFSYIVNPSNNSIQKTYRQWEACTNNCMQQTYASYNIIDWTEVAIAGFAIPVTWRYASCSYDCL